MNEIYKNVKKYANSSFYAFLPNYFYSDFFSCLFRRGMTFLLEESLMAWIFRFWLLLASEAVVGDLCRSV